MPRIDMVKLRAGSGLQWASAEVNGPALTVNEVALVDGQLVVGDGISKVTSLSPVGSSTVAAAETIVIGDSIDAANGGWFEQLCFLSNQRVSRLSNAGIGGQNTSQFLARFSADVVARKPNVVVIGGPTNDFQTTFSGGAAEGWATTRANYEAMWQLARAAGITTVMRNCPPVTSAGAVAGGMTATERAAKVQEHNAWVTAWARARRIPVLDIWTPLVGADGWMISAYAGDAVHPNTDGSLAAAEYLLTSLPSCFNGAVSMAAIEGQLGQMIPNGVAALFNVDSNSDGMSNGWNYVNTAGSTASRVSGSAAVRGFWQRIVATSSQSQIYVDVPVVAGRTYECLARLRNTGGTALMFRVGNTAPAVDLALPGVGREGIVRGVATAIATGNCRVQIGFAGGVTSGDFQVAQVMFRDVTPS